MPGRKAVNTVLKLARAGNFPKSMRPCSIRSSPVLLTSWWCVCFRLRLLRLLTDHFFPSLARSLIVTRRLSLRSRMVPRSRCLTLRRCSTVCFALALLATSAKVEITTPATALLLRLPVVPKAKARANLMIRSLDLSRCVFLFVMLVLLAYAAPKAQVRASLRASSSKEDEPSDGAFPSVV